MNRVFINGRQLSNEAAAVVLKLYPNGGTFSEEYVYRNLRKITKELLPEGCEKTPTQIRAELDKFISEECTVKIDIEGVTCEEFKRKMTLEDSHQKAMDKLSEMAQKEHLEALEKGIPNLLRHVSNKLLVELNVKKILKIQQKKFLYQSMNLLTLMVQKIQKQKLLKSQTMNLKKYI